MSPDMKPGDEIPPESGAGGANVCPDCSGKGRVRGDPCPACDGTGQVEEAVGGG